MTETEHKIYKLLNREGKGAEELLTSVAEEAAELAQAALKLRRYYDKTSPVAENLTEESLQENLTEEFSDVFTCISLLVEGAGDIEQFLDEVKKIQDKKENRWCQRLTEQREREQRKETDWQEQMMRKFAGRKE